MKMDKKYFPFTPEQRKNNLEENQASLDISYSEALPPRQKERPWGHEGKRALYLERSFSKVHGAVWYTW